jgi:uncharacterized protein (DUF1330 family)
VTGSAASFVVGPVELSTAEARRTIERFGGDVRLAGRVTALDGGEAPTEAVVVEFPDAVAAAAWFDATEDGQAGRRLWLIEPDPRRT